MDKDYMLVLVRERIEQLQQRYKLAARCRDDNGELITNGAAAAIRTQCKRDLQILKVIEQLLLYCSSSLYLDDEDIIAGFHRLCEPTERFRRQK